MTVAPYKIYKWKLQSALVIVVAFVVALVNIQRIIHCSVDCLSITYMYKSTQMRLKMLF